MSEASADFIEVTGLAQRIAWHEGKLPQLERLAPDLWSIPIPIPLVGPRPAYVNVYALATDAGFILIDSGWDSDEAWISLQRGLQELGGSVTDVSGCLVTHYHPDHIGLARRVREASGGWVGLHPADRDVVADPEFSAPPAGSDGDIQWVLSLGATLEEARGVFTAAHRLEARGRVALPDRLIEDGDLVVDSPARKLRALHTPGHTPGHLCFLEETAGLLFSGDHILPRISPHVAASRDLSVDALGRYLESLRKTVRAGVEVMPGHEWRFCGAAARAEEIVTHHVQRLSDMLDVIRNQPGVTPWDLAGLVPWSRPWNQYQGLTKLHAVNETAAHAFHLWHRGELRMVGAEVPRFLAT